MLPVSVPTHSALMAPVAEIMDAALAEVALGTPAVPVVANVKAEAISAPDEIHAALVAQVTGMVRWRESVMWMADQGVEKLVEVGAGKILSGLTRRIDKELETQSLSVPADIEAFL
jgi:[acyl-carrier-protein] S-malonyltransferase